MATGVLKGSHHFWWFLNHNSVFPSPLGLHTFILFSHLMPKTGSILRSQNHHKMVGAPKKISILKNFDENKEVVWMLCCTSNHHFNYTWHCFYRLLENSLKFFKLLPGWSFCIERWGDRRSHTFCSPDEARTGTNCIQKLPLAFFRRKSLLRKCYFFSFVMYFSFKTFETCK